MYEIKPRKDQPLFASVLFLLVTTTVTALAEPSAKTIDQVKRGVVSITTFDQDGSHSCSAAVSLFNPIRLVTSIHVLKGASRATVRTFDGQSYCVEGIVALNEDTTSRCCKPARRQMLLLCRLRDTSSRKARRSPW